MSRVSVPVEMLAAAGVAWSTAWFCQQPAEGPQATLEPSRRPDATQAIQRAPGAACEAPEISRAIGEWTAHQLLRDVSPRYVEQSASIVTGFAATMGLYALEELADRVNAERWLAQLQERGLAAKSRNHYRNALARFVEFCTGHGWVSHNAIAATPRARVQKHRARITPSVEDVVALIDYARKDWRKRDRWLVYLAAASTGLRWGQLKGLEWEHVRLEADPPHFDLPARLCKNGEPAIVWLTAELAEALRDRRGRTYSFVPNAGDPPPERVFLAVPKPTSFDRDLVGAGLAKGGGDRGTLSFHSLRHFASNRMAWSGGFTTAERTRQNQHRSPAMTTGVYSDPSAVDLGRKVHQMSPLLEGVAS